MKWLLVALLLAALAIGVSYFVFMAPPLPPLEVVEMNMVVPKTTFSLTEMTTVNFTLKNLQDRLLSPEDYKLVLGYQRVGEEVVTEIFSTSLMLGPFQSFSESFPIAWMALDVEPGEYFLILRIQKKVDEFYAIINSTNVTITIAPPIFELLAYGTELLNGASALKVVVNADSDIVLKLFDPTQDLTFQVPVSRDEFRDGREEVSLAMTESPCVAIKPGTYTLEVYYMPTKPLFEKEFVFSGAILQVAEVEMNVSCWDTSCYIEKLHVWIRNTGDVHTCIGKILLTVDTKSTEVYPELYLPLPPDKVTLASGYAYLYDLSPGTYSATVKLIDTLGQTITEYIKTITIS